MTDFDLQHALKVASKVSSDGEKLAALLHDAIEDGHATHEEIAEACGAQVALIVECLTRAEGETYDEYVRRIAGATVLRQAARVKLADLQANLDRMDPEHQSLEVRYLRAQVELQNALLQDRGR